jgi:hypothetical protein
LTAKDAKGAKLQSKERAAKRHKGDGFFEPQMNTDGRRFKPRHLGFICVYLRPSAVRNGCQATLTAKDAKGAKLQSKERAVKRHKGDGFF